MHLLNHPAAVEQGSSLWKGSQVCALAGARDFGVICNCASRASSCPEPDIVGTTMGLGVHLPHLGNRKEAEAFLKAHPNDAYLRRKTVGKEAEPIICNNMLGLVAAGLPGCPNKYE
jgi:hypothetical protein